MGTIGGALPTLRANEFELIRLLAYEHFGLDLRSGKEGLVAARLGRRLRELGLRSYREYYDHVVSDSTGAAMTAMVDCLTTNHTSFFREARHFDFLRDTIFPALKTRPQIHIWSAACSSGEEPYSIAMSWLEESHGEFGTRLRIKATDISTKVLERARRGEYSSDRIKEIPLPILQRYLVRDASGDTFAFKNAVRTMIEFQYLNLIGRLPEGYRCSVIFCRNIMIYFDKRTQQDLVQRLSAHLEDGGYLFIGHAESLNSIEHGLSYVSPAIYQKPGARHSGQNGRL
ncbi:MAG: methyltransferase, CheR-type [Acidobacteriaceae bacterium]|nr:methyltransferase, CheR-type [Acidobacteriaceae bacterium]